MSEHETSLDRRRYLDSSRRADTYRKERNMWKSAAEAEASIGKRLAAENEALRKALQKISDLIDSETGEPLDDAIEIAKCALTS